MYVHRKLNYVSRCQFHPKSRALTWVSLLPRRAKGSGRFLGWRSCTRRAGTPTRRGSTTTGITDLPQRQPSICPLDPAICARLWLLWRWIFALHALCLSEIAVSDLQLYAGPTWDFQNLDILALFRSAICSMLNMKNIAHVRCCMSFCVRLVREWW